MTVLKHSDPGVQRAKFHPALKGLRQMARGAFCSVYDKGDTVLKLTCDKIQYGFSRDAYCPEGPYFPRLITDHGEVGETRGGLSIYLMEMEKLSAIGNRAPIEVKRMRRSLLSQTERHIRSGSTVREMKEESYKGLGNILNEGALPAGLLDALDQVRDWMSNYECCVDFHAKNLMMRGDQLILNDIVCDSDVVVNIFRKNW